jgi:7-keto-8-aminopelargonate synthetase-like enzyme
MYPAVPEGDARIRLFMSAGHTDDQIAQLMTALAATDPESASASARATGGL